MFLTIGPVFCFDKVFKHTLVPYSWLGFGPLGLDVLFGPECRPADLSSKGNFGGPLFSRQSLGLEDA